MVTINGIIGDYGYGMMGYGGMLFGLLFWILIIAIAYLLIKRLLSRIKLAVKRNLHWILQRKDMQKEKLLRKNLKK